MGKKEPRVREQIDTRKRPRAVAGMLSRTDRPIWNFSIFDRYSWRKDDGLYEDDPFLDIASYLRDNSKRTWAEIVREVTMNHWIPVKQLSAAAKTRLQEVKLDDVDELFSLRLSGTRRLWGLREDSVFIVIWWDPHHRVYPVAKKS